MNVCLLVLEDTMWMKMKISVNSVHLNALNVNLLTIVFHVTKAIMR